MYYTAMPNLSAYKKELILLGIGLVLATFALFGNPSLSFLQTRGSELAQVTPTPTPDPAKDRNSLDNYISYTLPPMWRKTDYIDTASGIDTITKIVSPDFNALETGVESGVGIIIDRTYDLNAEDSLKAKLNTVYGFDTYNVMPIKINDKNAMTMHQDKNGHHRYIYISTGKHLWEITITSKSLEDEQKYQGQIDIILNSLKLTN